MNAILTLEELRQIEVLSLEDAETNADLTNYLLHQILMRMALKDEAR